jgi:hypothetical protein
MHTYTTLTPHTHSSLPFTTQPSISIHDATGYVVAQETAPITVYVTSPPQHAHSNGTCAVNITNGTSNVCFSANASSRAHTTANFTLTGTTSVALMQGIAKFSDLALKPAGTAILVFALGASNVTISQVVSITASSPSALTYTAPLPSTVAVAGVAFPLSAVMRDVDGNPVNVTGTPVSVVFDATPGSCIPAVCSSGPLTVLTETGMAMHPGISLLTAGRYTVRLSAVALGLTTSATNISVSASESAALELMNDVPSSIYASRSVAPGPRLRVRDAFGNTVTNFGGKVTVSVWKSPVDAAGLAGSVEAVPVDGMVAVSSVFM